NRTSGYGLQARSVRLLDASLRRAATLGVESKEETMNAANLQIEGLLMAMAAINRRLVDRGILASEEIEQALAEAEAGMVGDDRALEGLTPANRDAVAFPLRWLRAANASGEAA